MNRTKSDFADFTSWPIKGYEKVLVLYKGEQRVVFPLNLEYGTKGPINEPCWMLHTVTAGRGPRTYRLSEIQLLATSGESVER